MIVPDLNLLVYAHSEEVPLHSLARQWWEQLVNGEERIGVPWIVATGFVRLMTHPGVQTRPTTTDQAVNMLRAWFQFPAVNPLNPGPQHIAILGALLAAAGIGGNLVTDAHIAALAIEHQAEVHSNDRDFARFPGLRWHNPL